MICNIWCWFRLPETKDRTFGEIDLLFDNHIPARKFKYTKVDRKFLAYLRTILGDSEANGFVTEFAHQDQYEKKNDTLAFGSEKPAEHLESVA